jgi:ectoine hydroxylase-related dioxygenase (phytanoyl-CoA dioxygenase family)
MSGMTDREKYLFDLQGFLVVRDFLSAADVARLNAAFDANMDRLEEDEEIGSYGSDVLEGARRGVFNGMLTWDAPHCDVFRTLLSHKGLLPYLDTLLGRGWHSDSPPVAWHSTKGAEGLALHMGDAHPQGGAYYECKNGRMRNGLMVFSYALTDVEPGDGGFCCIPGSHKVNFIRPIEITLMQQDADIVVNPRLRAGDLLIFTEALTHGTMPWLAEGVRRALLYRYSPKWVMYGPGFHTNAFPEWVSELTEAQRAVLEPAYFYGRPLIEADATTVVRPDTDPDEIPYRYNEDRSLSDA